MVASCLPRANGLPLTVNLTVHRKANEGDWLFDPVLAEVLPHSKRWHHLHMALDYGRRDVQVDGSNNGQELRCLDALLLRELHIEGCSFNGSGDWPQWDWTRWNTPNLRHLTTDYYFPHALPGLATVTRLRVSLCINDDSTSRIFKEISRMVHLLDLALSFSNDSDDTTDIVLHEKMEFPSVQRLVIENHLHIPDEYRNPALKRSLFSSLFFPHVIDLRVELYGNASLDDMERSMRNLYFNKEVIRLFRHVDQFSLRQELPFHCMLAVRGTITISMVIRSSLFRSTCSQAYSTLRWNAIRDFMSRSQMSQMKLFSRMSKGWRCELWVMHYPCSRRLLLRCWIQASLRPGLKTIWEN